MDRRTFLGVTAAISLPVTAVAVTRTETQEQKCVRLVRELLTEIRKLPLPLKTRFGAAIDLGSRAGNHIRYGYSETQGHSLTVLIED